MFQDDTIYSQTYTTTNFNGSVDREYTRDEAITCDVQDINKEYAYKTYGLTDVNELKQVFDHTNATWVVGDQVEYLTEQWIVKLCNANMEKLGYSNHTYVIIAKVT